MFGLINRVFIVLLGFSGSLATKRISLNNEPYLARSISIDLNLDYLSQGLCHYSFMISLGRCGGSCNTFGDLSCRTCVPNETEGVNLNVFNTITRINESKTYLM